MQCDPKHQHLEKSCNEGHQQLFKKNFQLIVQIKSSNCLRIKNFEIEGNGLAEKYVCLIRKLLSALEEQDYIDIFHSSNPRKIA